MTLPNRVGYQVSNASQPRKPDHASHDNHGHQPTSTTTTTTSSGSGMSSSFLHMTRPKPDYSNNHNNNNNSITTNNNNNGHHVSLSSLTELVDNTRVHHPQLSGSNDSNNSLSLSGLFDSRQPVAVEATVYAPVSSARDDRTSPVLFTAAPTNPNQDTPTTKKRKNPSKEPETFTPEEMANRKQYVKTHRLLPNVLQVITETKREGMLPAVTLNSMDHLLNPLHGITSDPTTMLDKDTSFIIIEEFLSTQGIEITPSDSRDSEKIEERQQFISVLEQLKTTFRDEVERLDRVCNDFCYNILQTLKEQVTFRCVSEEEVHLKIATIKSKFIHTKNKLCHSVFRTILALHQQHNQMRKKNKSLPKRATEILIQWFFDHLNDPYPDENEKSAIGVACRLTLTQVHNWFGNKRIRYKHKCMEEENKKTSRKQKKVIEAKVVEQL